MSLQTAQIRLPRPGAWDVEQLPYELPRPVAQRLDALMGDPQIHIAADRVSVVVHLRNPVDHVAVERAMWERTVNLDALADFFVKQLIGWYAPVNVHRDQLIGAGHERYVQLRFERVCDEDTPDLASALTAILNEQPVEKLAELVEVYVQDDLISSARRAGMLPAERW